MQKVDYEVKLGVCFSMPTETEVMRRIALYYAVGIIAAAVIFRVVRSWLSGRRDRKG